jgi:hypothetical protein
MNPFKLPKEDTQLYEKRELERADEFARKKEFQNKPVSERHLDLASHGKIRALRDTETPVSVAPSRGITMPMKKETIREFILRKREILLVKMSTQNKEERIRKLEEAVETKEGALKSNEHLFEEHIARFEKYEDDKKHETEQAVMATEAKFLERGEKQVQINEIREQIDIMVGQTEKKREELEVLEKFKRFVEMFIPSDTFLTETLETRSPQKLLDQVQMMEENNLFLIEHLQESETQLETLKHQNRDKLRTTTTMHQSILADLASLERQSEAIQVRLQKQAVIVAPDQVLDLPTVKLSYSAKSHLSIEELRRKVEGVFRFVGGDPSSNTTVLDMLERVEVELEGLLKKRDCIEPDVLKMKEKEQDRERRQNMIVKKKELEAKHNAETQLRIEQRKKNSVKKTGRQVMVRSRPQEKSRKVVVVEVDPEEELAREFLGGV